MLESIQGNNLEYQKLSKEEMAQRGILGRLVGICADITNPTRNGRLYSESLWEQVFNSPLMKERIENGVCYGELGHPADREETDIEKIAVCLAEIPKKGRDGKLRAVFDILDTPNGRILKSLCDYGSTLGISSRGSGDLISDWDGQESVDPSTYNCEGFDIVLLPAVKEARLQYVTESLDKTRYKKTLRSKLQESLDKASDSDRKIMTESLDSLGIHLNEEEVELSRPFENNAVDTLTNSINGVMGAYQNANKWLDSVKEYLYTDLSCPFFSSFVHELAHSMPGRFDKFGDILHTANIAIPYPTTLELDRPLVSIDDAFDVIFYTLDSIKDNLNAFIKETDESNHGMACAAEGLLNDIESEYPMLFRLRDKWQQCEGDTVEFDKYVMQYVEHKDDLLESIIQYNEETGKYVVEGMEFNSKKNAKTWIKMNTPVKESITKASYVTQLDNDTQNEIKADLKANGISGKDLAYAMNGRICDLEDTIDIKKYLTEEQVGRDMMNNDKDMSDVLQPEVEKDKNQIIIENANEILDYDEDADDWEYSFEEDFDEPVENHSKIYNEEKEEKVEVGNTESDIDALQESLKKSIELEKKLAKLQEKLSASYARENKLKEDAGRYKNQIQQLAKKSKEIEILTEKLNTAEKQISEMENHNTQESVKLQESLSRKEQVTTKLTESVRDRDNKIKALQEALNDANEQKKHDEAEYKKLEADYSDAQKDIAQLKENYSKKLEQSNQLVEKYKNIAKNSIGKYIDSQATRLGVTSNEIKSRLPKSYNFKDIDSVCESLQEYKLNMSSLSFNPNSSLTEGIGVRAKNISNGLSPVNPDDDITDFDLKFAAQACK